MIKILVNGHDFKFLTHLIDYYNRLPGFRVVLDEIPGHNMSHEDVSRRLLPEADLIFCEWALGNAAWYSQNKRENQRLFIRLHHQEINLRYLEDINWGNVDQIIFICQENRDIFLRRFPFMKDRTSLIYNLIDCQSLGLDKLPGAYFNLGFIGSAPKRKSPHLAIEILKRLREKDDRYTLSIKGKHPWEYPWLWRSNDEREYYDKMYKEIRNSQWANAIVFDPHGNDIPEWFSKIGFLLSTSEHEGSHQSVAEGMASGTIPVIRNWAGAAKLYPPEFVVSSADAAAELIQKEHGRESLSGRIGEIKNFARTHFDLPVIIEAYNRLFKRLVPGFPDLSAAHNIIVTGKEPAGPLTVLHVCYISPGNQSGYEVRVIEETHMLTKQGIRIIIAGFYNPASVKSADSLASHRTKLEDLTGGKVHLFPTTHFFDMGLCPEAKCEIDDPIASLIHSHKIRIVHGQALYSTAHLLRVAEWTGVRVAFDAHGAGPEETKMAGGSDARVLHLGQLESLAIRKSHLKIFVSEKMKLHFSKKHETGDGNYLVLPCCVHPEQFLISEKRKEVLRTKKKFGKKFVFLYLGTLSIWQWPEAMFNLFRKYHEVNPESVLYLLVPGYDHPKALALAAKYSFPGNSVFLEEIPHADVGSTIGIADAGILLREPHVVNEVSSPTKFGEYLAAGIPVILTEGIGDYSQMAERLGIGVKISVTGEDFAATELKKLTLFTQSVMKDRASWSERCRQASHDYLDWDLHGEKLAREYQQLLVEGAISGEA